MLRWRLLSLIIGLTILALAMPASNRLQFDRHIGAMFKPTDSTFLDYQELQTSFGGNSIVILVYQDRRLATGEGLARNSAIAARVKGVEGVEGVLSSALIDRVVEKVQPASLLSSDPALFLKKNRVSEGFDKLFSGYLHSADHSRAAIVAMLDSNHSPETIIELAQIARDLPGEFGTALDGKPMIEEASIVGEPVLIHDGFAMIERDGARLATLTVAFLSLVVVISLADFRFVLLTSTMIGWSVVLTKAIMVWLGINMSLVSTILTAIVTVISVTAVLHLGVRFRIARSRGYTQQQAATAALSFVMLPIIWTCATDAAGFAALYASGILPIRHFGLMIAIAALAVCVSMALFAPSVMMLPGLQYGRDFLERWQLKLSLWLRRRCLTIAYWSIGHRTVCLTIAGLSVLVTIIGIGRVKTETSFLNNFRAGSTVVRAYAEVETHFGGAGVWDIVLDAPTELTKEYLQQVRKLEDDLRRINVDGARLTKVLSLADAEEIAGRAPLSNFVSSSARLSIMYIAMPVFFDALLTPVQAGQRKMRIMLRSRENMDSHQKSALIAAVERRLAAHVQSEQWQRVVGGEHRVRVTGYYVMMARLISQLVSDQWRCFCISGLLVWALLACATRSLRLATAALVPNLLPVFLVLALVGIMGGKINMGAAMIAAVSIGLSIDGSVHFLSQYLRLRRRGYRASTAAGRAGGKIGVPVLLATIALVVGFGVMSTSDFVPTSTFGTLVAVALALGTAVNLTLLPALVAWIDSDRPSSKVA
jgi:predicted RND superfamily exporter protein